MLVQLMSWASGQNLKSSTSASAAALLLTRRSPLLRSVRLRRPSGSGRRLLKMSGKGRRLLRLSGSSRGRLLLLRLNGRHHGPSSKRRRRSRHSTLDKSGSGRRQLMRAARRRGVLSGRPLWASHLRLSQRCGSQLSSSRRCGRRSRRRHSRSRLLPSTLLGQAGRWAGWQRGGWPCPSSSERASLAQLK